jgi:uncharacterized membrane protein YoaK (UPF0700 family)
MVDGAAREGPTGSSFQERSFASVMDGEPTSTAISAKELLAWVLAAIAGFIDAVGYRTLRHLFTAHMSGNSARLGVFLGEANLASAVPMIAAVLLFVFGIAAGTALAETASRRGARAAMPWLLGAQVLLLAAFMGYGASVIGADGQVPGHSGRGFYLLAALAIVSIGFQVCALQHVGGQRARTTYVSGMLTRFAQEWVNWLFWMHDGTHRPRNSYLGQVLGSGTRSESVTRLLLFGGIWCFYLAGAIAGSFLDGRWRLWSLACPIVLLVAIIAFDQWRPFRP